MVLPLPLMIPEMELRPQRSCAQIKGTAKSTVKEIENVRLRPLITGVLLLGDLVFWVLREIQADLAESCWIDPFSQFDRERCAYAALFSSPVVGVGCPVVLFSRSSIMRNSRTRFRRRILRCRS